MKITHNTLGLLVFLIISNFLCYMDKNKNIFIAIFHFSTTFCSNSTSVQSEWNLSAFTTVNGSWIRCCARVGVFMSFSLLIYTISTGTRRLSATVNMTLCTLFLEEIQLMPNPQPYTNTFGQCSSLSNLLDVLYSGSRGQSILSKYPFMDLFWSVVYQLFYSIWQMFPWLLHHIWDYYSVCNVKKWKHVCICIYSDILINPVHSGISLKKMSGQKTGNNSDWGTKTFHALLHC